ncbi:MAG: mannitol dehydrogenase [Clostridiaceae bacterium]|nr:mannitol dehydrogenase [Clostridiaceae bacterium]
MKKAIMFGAGAIGRGFIGQTFSQSGYHVTFVDIFPSVIDALNEQGRYPVQIVSEQQVETVWVGPVSGLLSGDTDAVADAIADADLMATAVGVNALKAVAPTLAAGFSRRWQNGNLRPLDVIVCENKLDADKYLRELVRPHLPAAEQPKLDELIGFVEASIGRMVPVMPDALKKEQPLLIQVEPYHDLPVDAAGFRGPVPDLIALKPFAPFDFFIKRKLFVHNLGHAVTAYLGWLKHCSTIAEAVQDPEIRLLARRAMMESAVALSRYYQVPLEELTAHVDDLLGRFANRRLGDTVARVGRDPMRKLSIDDRLAGALRFSLQQGVEPQATALGLAAGLLFDSADDPAAVTMQEMIAKDGADAFLINHAGLAGSSELDLWRGIALTLKQALAFSLTPNK